MAQDRDQYTKWINGPTLKGIRGGRKRKVHHDDSSTVVSLTLWPM